MAPESFTWLPWRCIPVYLSVMVICVSGSFAVQTADSSSHQQQHHLIKELQEWLLRANLDSNQRAIRKTDGQASLIKPVTDKPVLKKETLTYTSAGSDNVASGLSHTVRDLSYTVRDQLDTVRDQLDTVRDLPNTVKYSKDTTLSSEIPEIKFRSVYSRSIYANKSVMPSVASVKNATIDCNLYSGKIAGQDPQYWTMKRRRKCKIQSKSGKRSIESSNKLDSNTSSNLQRYRKIAQKTPRNQELISRAASHRIRSRREKPRTKERGQTEEDNGQLDSVKEVIPGSWDAYPNLCPLQCECEELQSQVDCTDLNIERIPPLPVLATHLDLSFNSIIVLKNHSFSEAASLIYIRMENVGLELVESEAFRKVQHVQHINLGFNQLTHLPAGVFSANSRLRVLNLHGNSFTSIPDQAMIGLHHLHTLNMSQNRLDTPALGNGFNYTKKLHMIDLSFNPLKNLQDHSFQVSWWWDGQVNQAINLSHCQIEHISPHSLSQLYHLESLSLRGNYELSERDVHSAMMSLPVARLQQLDLSHIELQNISALFNRSEFKKLRELDLSHNAIASLPTQVFYYMEGLRILDLSYNALAAIDNIAGLLQLTHLNLAFNSIDLLEAKHFDGLQSLQTLDISHNLLVSVDHAPFEDLWELRELDLSCNLITDFSVINGLENLAVLHVDRNRLSKFDAIERLMRLEYLDLHKNTIRIVNEASFQRSQLLRYLNLSGNIIEQIYPNAFRQSSVETLDLSDNRLVSVSDYSWTSVKHLDLSRNIISNISSSAFYNLKGLQELILSENNLHTLPRNVFQQAYHLQVLSLGRNPLASFLETASPSDQRLFNGLRSINTLNMEKIDLRSIPMYLFKNLTRLKVLNLSSNKLNFIPISSFIYLKDLEVLDLSDNSLTIPDPLVFNVMPHLKLLDLSLNPLQCSCDLMPFRHWVFTSKYVVLKNVEVTTAYQCASPAEWSTVPLRQFQLDSDYCTHQEKVVIYATVGGILLVVLITAAIIVYRYKSWQAPEKMYVPNYRTMDESSSSVQSSSQHSSQDRRSEKWV